MFCLVEKNKIHHGNIKPYILYENEQYYYLPRYIKKYINDNNIIKYTDKNFIPKQTTNFKLTSNFRENQTIIFNNIIDRYNKNGFLNGILHARPGFGKTFISIALASYFQKKTLIVIDTKKIIDQQIEQILLHTNISDDRIGLIKGNIFDVDNKDFIITTPQTLASKIKKDIKDIYLKFRDIGIDFVCQDEAHKMGVKYASASLLFNTRNVIGLSATPYNPKERDILIKGIFNEVIVKYGTYDFQPTIKFVKYNSALGDKYGKRIVWLWRNRFNQGRSIYNSKLHESETWIKTIYNITKNEVTNKNKIIIICMTKKQLHFISDYLQINEIKSAKLYSEENDIDKINDNVIIATYKYASHAFDHAELSRLIISVPLMGKKSLIQTIGRIVRRFEGKTNAIVYDLIDIDDKFRGIFTETIKNKINILNNEFDDCKFIET